MLSNLIYNYLYPDEIDYAVNLILFYEKKIINIHNEDINDSNKLMKIKRLEFTIKCIKNSYGL